MHEKLILRAIDWQLFLFLSISVNNCCMINSPISFRSQFFYCALYAFKVFSLEYRKVWPIREKTPNHKGFIISRCSILQWQLGMIFFQREGWALDTKFWNRVNCKTFFILSFPRESKAKFYSQNWSSSPKEMTKEDRVW